MPTEQRQGEQPSLWTTGAQPSASTAEVSLADIWRDCSAKQQQLNARKAAVEGLSNLLSEVCADILKNGINTEKIHQTHMLETGLLQARRDLVRAQQQFDAALWQGRIEAERKLGGSG